MSARKCSVGKYELQGFQLEELKAVPQNSRWQSNELHRKPRCAGVCLDPNWTQGGSGKASGEGKDVRNFELQLSCGLVGSCTVMESIEDPALNVNLQYFSSS